MLDHLDRKDLPAFTSALRRFADDSDYGTAEIECDDDGEPLRP